MTLKTILVRILFFCKTLDICKAFDVFFTFFLKTKKNIIKASCFCWVVLLGDKLVLGEI